MSADSYTTCPKCEDTFREYYEFYGAEEGVVEWDYSGSCRTCGLAVSFKGAHPFYDVRENQR